MGYHSLAECVLDLELTKQLVVIEEEVDPHLEAAAIQRRVYQAGGPALFFRRVKGTAFPLLGNLFGTLDRARYLFSDTLDSVRRLVELKADPGALARHPWRYRGVPRTLWRLRPRRVWAGPILANQAGIADLPRVQCWPMDGGPFITLPQVYTEDPDRPGLARSNLGMYRVQLAGNEYEPGREVGLHYQIHRGIGVHHAAAIRRGEPLRVNVFVGGPPAMTVAAVMPLPEGLPELAFAGALGGRRVAMVAPRRLSAHAGRGRFRDLRNDRPGSPQARGPVRRPPRLLQPHPRLPRAARRSRLPPRQCHLAVHLGGPPAPGGYLVRRPDPRADRPGDPHASSRACGPSTPSMRPASIRCSWPSAASATCPTPTSAGPRRSSRSPTPSSARANCRWRSISGSSPTRTIPTSTSTTSRRSSRHVLRRVDWSNDLHFQTRTTIDTLDYSGHGLNQGSKVVIAAAGPVRRTLPTELPAGLRLPDGFREPRVVMPGILAIQGPAYRNDDRRRAGLLPIVRTGRRDPCVSR